MAMIICINYTCEWADQSEYDWCSLFSSYETRIATVAAVAEEREKKKSMNSMQSEHPQHSETAETFRLLTIDRSMSWPCKWNGVCFQENQHMIEHI